MWESRKESDTLAAGISPFEAASREGRFSSFGAARPMAAAAAASSFPASGAREIEPGLPRTVRIAAQGRLLSGDPKQRRHDEGFSTVRERSPGRVGDGQDLACRRFVSAAFKVMPLHEAPRPESGRARRNSAAGLRFLAAKAMSTA